MRRLHLSTCTKFGAFLACLAPLVVPPFLGGRAQTHPPERVAKIREFKDAPVVIKEVRNLQKGEGWFKDLEVEVQNVSDKPVYFVSVLVEFPGIQAPPAERRADGGVPARSASGLSLRYGDFRLVNLQELAGQQDLPLNPGDTYVLKVPEARAEGLEHMKRRMNLPPEATQRIELEVNTVSFGDGTGYYGGKKVAYPRKKAESTRPRPDPTSRKISFVKAADTKGGAAPPLASKAAGQVNNECTGNCEKYYIDSHGATCDAIEVSCEKGVAKVGSSGTCSRYTQFYFYCWEQPCYDDVIDTTAECAQPCADADGDGWPAASCGGDDCRDDDPTINPMEFEICNDGKDNDCWLGADQSDPSCYNCVRDQRVCIEEQGVWDPIYCFCYPSSPVVVDTTGNGFALTSAGGGVRFDLNGDGNTEPVSWTAADTDDAWLALDRDGNGTIDDGRELFGNATSQPPSFTPNGFLALSEYDKPRSGGNSDGVIDSRDSIFASLRLWQDVNHDGVSQPGELHTLPSLDVARIHLGYKESKRTDAFGNRFRYRAKVDDAKGAKAGRWAWDVFLVSGSPPR
jgi:hypothetical protein